MQRIERSCAGIIGMMLAVVSGSATAQTHPEKPTWKYEKCYRVARAGHNDCFTARNSCAGTTTQDAQPDAWIYVPEGTCEKLVGGSLSPAREA